MYSDRHLPAQKLDGLYLFATTWITKRSTLPGVVKTDVTPSLKCAARYVSEDVSNATLDAGSRHGYAANKVQRT